MTGSSSAVVAAGLLGGYLLGRRGNAKAAAGLAAVLTRAVLRDGTPGDRDEEASDASDTSKATAAAREDRPEPGPASAAGRQQPPLRRPRSPLPPRRPLRPGGGYAPPGV